MQFLQVTLCIILLVPSSLLSHQLHSHHLYGHSHNLYGHQPKVWLTVSSLVEKVKVNGLKYVTKRKIELNWMNLPVSHEFEMQKKSPEFIDDDKNTFSVALFDHDQSEPDSETALVSLQPKLVSQGRFRSV